MATHATDWQSYPDAAYAVPSGYALPNHFSPYITAPVLPDMKPKIRKQSPLDDEARTMASHGSAHSPASSASSTELDVSTIRSLILAALGIHPELQFEVIEPLRPTPLDGLPDTALLVALEQIKSRYPHVADAIERKRQEALTVPADDLSWVEPETRGVLAQFAQFPMERQEEVGWRLAADIYKIIDRILNPVHGHTKSLHKVNAVSALSSVGYLVIGNKRETDLMVSTFDQNVLLRLASAIKSILSVMSRVEEETVMGVITPLAQQCAQYGLTELLDVVSSLRPVEVASRQAPSPTSAPPLINSHPHPHPQLQTINIANGLSTENQVSMSPSMTSPVSPYTLASYNWHGGITPSHLGQQILSVDTSNVMTAQGEESWQPGHFYSPHTIGPNYRIPRSFAVDERNA